MKNIFVNLFLLLLSSLIIVLLYWSFYPYKPMEIISPPKNLTPRIKAGEIFIYEANYCKYTDKSAYYRKQIINSFVVNLPESVSNIPEGCKKVNVSIPIPEYLPADKYKIRTMAVYEMNPIRKIVITYDTDEFEIVE